MFFDDVIMMWICHHVHSGIKFSVSLIPMNYFRGRVGRWTLPHAHWLSWSGGGEQGQMRHGGPVFKKALTARARPQNWWGKIAHARGAGSFCAMCSHDTSCPWRTQKRTRRTTRHQSTDSLLSISERVAPSSPVARI